MLAAEGNLRVANPTTPAQYFHLLRRQARIVKQRPLIVMTPKSLLRLPLATSRFEHLAHGKLRRRCSPSLASPERVTRSGSLGPGRGSTCWPGRGELSGASTTTGRCWTSSPSTASPPPSRSITGIFRKPSRTRAAGRYATPLSASPSTQASSPRRWERHAWITLNEPQVVASHGYRIGEHAPGMRDAAAAAAATHHLLLGHGLAAQAVRAATPGTPVGITFDLHPIRVLGEQGLDLVEQARAITDANLNGLFLEPALHGSYPALALPSLLPPADLIVAGDMETINQPLDFLGVNYYSSVYLRAGDPADLRRTEERSRFGAPGVVEVRPDGLERTPMGWIVDPEGLYEVLMRMSKEAQGLPLFVTENGCAAEDYINPDGAVNDVERVRYLHRHLDAAARAIKDGANLAGYFVWSLLDNFEWAWGYQKRFGIVFVDFGTQRRIPKSSARFYSDVIRANAVPLLH